MNNKLKKEEVAWVIIYGETILNWHPGTTNKLKLNFTLAKESCMMRQIISLALKGTQILSEDQIELRPA